MIDSGSGLDGQGTIVDAFAMVTDVAPTLYDIAGVSPPSACNDSARYPLQGVSLAPVLSGTSDRVHPAAEAWVMEQAGHVRVRKGQWKLVRKGTWRLVDPDEDWSISDFALYNLTNDRAEQTDLRSERPEKFRKLLGEWRTYREKYKVRDSF